MQVIKNHIIEGKHNKPILTDYFYVANNRPKPIVIFCHGYKGYKDWGSWNLVSKYFAMKDLFFIKMNFSHNGGTLENTIDFPDLEAFANNNYSIELDDLQSVISAILNTKRFNTEINKTNITLIGHSRGGGIVTLKAHEENRITKVISWAGISNIASRFPKGNALEQWKKNGVAYVLNSRTNQQMPNKYQVYENFLANKKRLNIQTAVENLKIPHLIIHGTNDEVVLLEEAENLHKWNKKSELYVVKDMNHSLGNTQPWLNDNMPKDMKITVNKSIAFIKK